jgi:hypothetical protein
MIEDWGCERFLSAANFKVGFSWHDVPGFLGDLHDPGVTRTLIDVPEQLPESFGISLRLTLDLSPVVSMDKVYMQGPCSTLTLLSDVFRHHPVTPYS